MSDEPECAALETPLRNTPWIGEFVADDGDPTYFIYIEQRILFTVNTFTRAIFMWFSLFYVFNLEYQKNTRDMCLFFQEFIFGLPDNMCKKSSTYLSVSTDILSCACR